MKAKEIRSMDRGMIAEKIAELKKELVKINAQIAIGTAIKNPGQVKKIKKTIARMIIIDEEKKAGKDGKKGTKKTRSAKKHE